MHEVGVIGLGAMGSMALWHLAKRGIPAIGFEQFNLGNDRAAHSGETRLFRTAYLEGDQYIPLLQDALKQWNILEGDTKTRLLSLDGSISIGPSDDPSISAIADSMRRFGLNAEILGAEDMKRRFPALNPLPHEVGILDKHGGILAAELSVIAAATRAEEMGAAVHRRTEVLRIDEDAEGVWIRTGRGDYRVRRVILTAGAWVNRFVGSFGLTPQVKPWRVGMTWFALRRPENFRPDVFPAMMRFTYGSLFGLFPTQDGRTIKAGSDIEVREVEGPEDVPPRAERDLAERTIAMIRDFYPDIYPEPLRTAFWTDGYTPDHRPLLGPIPGHERIILAAGFSGHGFKMAPTFGAALADYAAEGETALPVAAFRPAHLAADAVPSGR